MQEYEWEYWNMYNNGTFQALSMYRQVITELSTNIFKKVFYSSKIKEIKLRIQVLESYRSREAYLKEYGKMEEDSELKPAFMDLPKDPYGKIIEYIVCKIKSKNIND